LSEVSERDAAVLGELIYTRDAAWEAGFWARLDDWSKSPPAALSDRERVELLIELANGKAVTGAKWNALAGVTVVRGADAQPIQPYPKARAWLESCLAAALAPTARRHVFARAARVCNGQVVLVPDSRPGAKQRIIARHVSAALAYSVMLLTDDRGEFADKLLRCPYSQCRRFFFKRTGVRGSPLKACIKEHGRLADNEKAVERMRRRKRS
jgi:hypothetical protein